MNGYFDVEAFGVAVVIVLAIVYLALIGLSIAQYVMFALGLYDTARKRQIRHAWLAWVPLIGDWTLGAVVDWLAARRGQNRRWRTVMLWICITIVASYVLFFAAALVGALVMALWESEEALVASWGIYLFVVYFLLLLACLAYLPCRAVCLYKVYEELVPEKAVKYLILSYLVPLAAGICMMRCARVPVEPVTAAPADGFVPQDPFAGLEKTEKN